MEQLKFKGYTIYLTTKFSDFISALKNSKQSVSKDDLNRYVDFTKSFGMEGWKDFLCLTYYSLKIQ